METQQKVSVSLRRMGSTTQASSSNKLGHRGHASGHHHRLTAFAQLRVVLEAAHALAVVPTPVHMDKTVCIGWASSHSSRGAAQTGLMQC